MMTNKTVAAIAATVEPLGDRGRPRVVSERMRLEAAFRKRGVRMATVSNLILVRYPQFCTGIWLESAGDSGITAQIQTYLGTVLDLEETRGLLEKARVERGGQRVELTSDAMLRVTWQAQLASPIDADAICAAYEEQLKVATRAWYTVAESFDWWQDPGW
jgi:hypothetical protein